MYILYLNKYTFMRIIFKNIYMLQKKHYFCNAIKLKVKSFF